MHVPEEKQPSAASELPTSSREPTLAPSANSMAGYYDKDARSALSSRDESGKGSSSSQSSIMEEHAGTSEQVVEKSESLAKVQTARTQNGDALHQIQTREDGSEYPTGLKLGLISLALCLSVFLIALE